jgi:NitT/TauT family transport system substrate-binding protein
MRKMRTLKIITSILLASILLVGLVIFMIGRFAVEDEKPTLKVGYLPITHSTAMVMAHQEGNGAFANFNMEVVMFGSWPELTEALFAGRIDGAIMLFELALAGRQKGIPLRVVALGHRDGNVLVSRPEITTVADLSGRRVAIPSRFSVHHILLYKALLNAGLSMRDIDLVEMAPPDMPAALGRDEIAAYVVAEPFGAVAEVLGVGKVLLPSQEIWLDSTCCVLALREEVLRDYPDAATELTVALLAAAEVAERDPGKAAAVSSQYFGHRVDILVPAIARTTFRRLEVSIAEFVKHQQYLLELGVLPEPINLGELIIESLVRDNDPA